MTNDKEETWKDITKLWIDFCYERSREGLDYIRFPEWLKANYNVPKRIQKANGTPNRPSSPAPSSQNEIT